MAEALATGNHPLVALVNLVEKQDQLDDNQWAVLEEQITTAFGKSLGVAISRGKINFMVQKKLEWLILQLKLIRDLFRVFY